MRTCQKHNALYVLYSRGLRCPECLREKNARHRATAQVQNGSGRTCVCGKAISGHEVWFCSDARCKAQVVRGVVDVMLGRMK